MRVLFVSSEVASLAKTDGLADVSAALPRALAALGIDIRIIMPGYP
jgi:starch synthase